MIPKGIAANPKRYRSVARPKKRKPTINSMPPKKRNSTVYVRRLSVFIFFTHPLDSIVPVGEGDEYSRQQYDDTISHMPCVIAILEVVKHKAKAWYV